ncbi:MULTISPECIES: hypothetical protein [Sphingomonas]|uniref:hypothetical protein n=1 Tax=Sphingomonas TaxID=13687 RepID=UPI000DEED468|nr:MULTISPECIES: hypothetical protein [Sphingomonas]
MAMDSSNVTPIKRQGNATSFKPGQSGNPHGVTGVERDLKMLQSHLGELFDAKMAKNIPPALRLHNRLLKNTKEMTVKEMLQLLELTYKYGLGTARQMEARRSTDTLEYNTRNIDPAKKAAMIAILQETEEDANNE